MSRAAAELGLWRRGVLVRIGRGGEVGELRGAKAKLTGRLGGAEWYWSNGSTASSKLQWQWRAAVVFWASGEQKRANA